MSPEPRLIFPTRRMKKKPHHHDRGIDQKSESQSAVPSEKKLIPLNGLRKDRINGPLLNLLADQTDPDKDRDDDTEEIDACQPTVLNDLGLLPHGQGAQHNRTAYQEQAKEHEVIENLVSEILFEGVQRNHNDPAPQRPACTCSIKRSSSVSLCGTSDTSRPPDRRTSSTRESTRLGSSSLSKTCAPLRSTFPPCLSAS